MRTIIIAGSLALALAACNSTDATTLVTQAQAAALQGCAFLPTAETVASIIAKGNSTVSTAEQVADAICSAVKASGAAAANPIALLAGPPPAPIPQPTVLGVPVHGRFVGKAS